MEVLRKRSVTGTIYRIVDDLPNQGHCYCIEYAKTFNDEGEIIYGWYPLYEPKNKCFRNWEEVKELFDKTLAMKEFRVYIDITIATTIYVKAENEQEAKRLAMEKCVEDPYHYATTVGALVDAGIQDVEELND